MRLANRAALTYVTVSRSSLFFEVAVVGNVEVLGVVGGGWWPLERSLRFVRLAPSSGPTCIAYAAPFCGVDAPLGLLKRPRLKSSGEG